MFALFFLFFLLLLLFFFFCPQYRVLMSGCWRALFFFLGPSPRAGQGDRRSFFSGSRQYRSTLIHHTWENNLTQPLLEGMEGILANHNSYPQKCLTL